MKTNYCTYRVILLDGSHFKVVAKSIADARAQAYEYLVHSVVLNDDYYTCPKCHKSDRVCACEA